MGATVPERLATLETAMCSVKDDVEEIKRDVKQLLIADAGRNGIGAFLARVAPWWAIAIAALALFFDLNQVFP